MKTNLKEIQDLCKWYSKNGAPNAVVPVSTKIKKAGENNELLYFASENEILINLVVPFFEHLGWGKKNFMFEFYVSGEGKRIDLIITDDMRSKIFAFVEAKKLTREKNGKEQDPFVAEIIHEQLISYYDAINNGMGDKDFLLCSSPLLIATNGDMYYIFDTNGSLVIPEFKLTSHTEELYQKMYELLRFDTSKFETSA